MLAGVNFLLHYEPTVKSCYSNFQSEENYDRWQLLKEPVSLENFLVQPLLTGLFFDYALRLEPELTHPIVVHEKKATLNVWAWEPVRYRYKFFPANKVMVEVINSLTLLDAKKFDNE